MELTDVKLKPCPFCGGKPDTEVYDRLITIRCNKCKYQRIFNGIIRFKSNYPELAKVRPSASEGPDGKEFYYREAHEDAARSWNTRALLVNENCLKSGTLSTPHDEGISFSDHDTLIVEGVTEFYLKSEADEYIASLNEKIENCKDYHRKRFLRFAEKAKNEKQHWIDYGFGDHVTYFAVDHKSHHDWLEFRGCRRVRTSLEWATLWEKIEHLCRSKAEQYRSIMTQNLHNTL